MCSSRKESRKFSEFVHLQSFVASFHAGARDGFDVRADGSVCSIPRWDRTLGTVLLSFC